MNSTYFNKWNAGMELFQTFNC